MYQTLRIIGRDAYEPAHITDHADGSALIIYSDGTRLPAIRRAEGVYELPDGSFDAFINPPTPAEPKSF